MIKFHHFIVLLFLVSVLGQNNESCNFYDCHGIFSSMAKMLFKPAFQDRMPLHLDDNDEKPLPFEAISLNNRGVSCYIFRLSSKKQLKKRNCLLVFLNYF